MKPQQFFIASAISLIANSAYAESPEPDEVEISIGGFIGSGQSLYIDGDEKVEFMPRIRARWNNFFINGLKFGGYLYEDRNWQVRAAIGLGNVEDTDRDSSDVLDDMDDLDSTIEGKLGFAYEAEWGEVDLALSTDLNDTYDGYAAELAYSYPLKVGSWLFEISVEMEWLSKDVNRYYYGVTAEQAKPGREFYQPDSGVNYALEQSAMYSIDESQSILIRAVYKTYSSEITDSPIVDRDHTAEIGIGYVYRF
ncbi:MAG: MipA/OmpV family protein [Candidatus Thiodiazotropha sp.]